jgi:hypothetical protein
VKVADESKWLKIITKVELCINGVKSKSIGRYNVVPMLNKVPHHEDAHLA